ncbi:MAG: hypothetical protein FJZ63_04515 [Chlamydiae bacterium]|nr:hypothetical protein [Chlamydiota bacterium]
MNILTGTGELGKFFQIPESSGVRFDGMWMGDYNALLCGVDGVQRLTDDSLLIIDLSIDRQIPKREKIKG